MSFYRAKPRKGLRRRPFLGAPSRLSPDRTGDPVISKLEEKDNYDVGGPIQTATVGPDQVAKSTSAIFRSSGRNTKIISSREFLNITAPHLID